MTLKHNSGQLFEVLEVPIIPLELDNLFSSTRQARLILGASGCCCVTVTASVCAQDRKLSGILSFYRRVRALKKFRKQLIEDFPAMSANFIGIYPSIEYPACVYELDTAAAKYVGANILPPDGSALKKQLKYFFEKILGVNPSLGGIGLILSRE
jgi:hypothetical protein